MNRTISPGRLALEVAALVSALAAGFAPPPVEPGQREGRIVKGRQSIQRLAIAALRIGFVVSGFIDPPEILDIQRAIVDTFTAAPGIGPQQPVKQVGHGQLAPAQGGEQRELGGA